MRFIRSGRSSQAYALTCRPALFSFPCWKVRERSPRTAKLWAPLTRPKRRPERFAKTGAKTLRKTRCMAPMASIPPSQKSLSFFGLTKSFDPRVDSRMGRREGLILKSNIKELSLKELEAELVERSEPSYRAKQVWQWLFQKRAVSFAEMTNLSAALRARLAEDFTIGRLALLRDAVSKDGTRKFLFGLSDGHSIESVLIPEAKRLTLCVSTQAGCGFGCAFCASAVLGLKRNLRASEILEQILAASLAVDQRITHVVLMGMGEPLANYAETVKALNVMTDTSWGIGISPRRITLSTVGLVPQIQRLMEETDRKSTRLNSSHLGISYAV